MIASARAALGTLGGRTAALAGAAWRLDSVHFQHAGTTRPSIAGVTLDVSDRRFTAILGPNGVGKSTLVHLLLGTLVPQAGTIAFRAQPLDRWPRDAFARTVGVVPQSETEQPFTVREYVAMGRYPHLGAWRREQAHDRAAIAAALHRCDVADVADRRYAMLSGGEQQRVRLARALAQEPSVLVLDEPTAALDVRYEMATFELLRALCDAGTTIVLATHNVNLAARYADDLLLLHRGRVIAHGRAPEVLTAERISEVYEWPVGIVRHAGGAPQIVPRSSAEAARDGDAGHPGARAGGAGS